MENKIICPKCGAECDSQSNYCGLCGANLKDDDVKQDGPFNHTSEGRSNGINLDFAKDIKKSVPFNTTKIRNLKDNKKELAILCIAIIAIVGFFLIKDINFNYTTYQAGPIEYEFYKDAEISPENNVFGNVTSASSNYEFEFVTIQKDPETFNVTADAYASEFIRLNSSTSEPIKKYSDSKCPVDNVFFIIIGENVTNKYVGSAVFHTSGDKIFVFSVMSDDAQKVDDILHTVKFNPQLEQLSITPKKK